MITRIWHGKTKKKDADTYRKYVSENGIKEYLETDGNLDTQIWQKDENDITHIVTVTCWKDFDSIKKFAGDDFQKAKYYPEDKKYLLELEPHVDHYKSFTFSNGRIKNLIKQIKGLNDGDNWAEADLRKINLIEEKKLFVQPVPGKHSAAEILSHIIYWRNVIVRGMEGDFEFGKKTEKEQNFLSLELLKQKGLKRLLADFKESGDLLINFLKTKSDDFLDNEYKTGYTNQYMIESLISHDYYHLGQIGYVIALLK
ncbi:MAG: DinB family protein [Ignavibacteriaceae bacterium]